VTRRGSSADRELLRSVNDKTRMRAVPAAEAGWKAVESVLMTDASTRNCWCQFHVLENRAWRATTRDSRQDLLREQITTLDPPRGLVALAGDEPVGWCGVEPRTRLGHVLASRLVTSNSRYELDDPDVWAVYCILVPPPLRRQGIAAALLRCAIEHAQSYGARSIEGYPIDTSRRDGQLPPGFSTGTLAMFEREGFQRLAALPSGRTLVYRDVS
jgi:GNAT superfamily N-acetyltransferase